MARWMMLLTVCIGKNVMMRSLGDYLEDSRRVCRCAFESIGGTIVRAIKRLLPTNAPYEWRL